MNTPNLDHMNRLALESDALESDALEPHLTRDDTPNEPDAPDPVAPASWTFRPLGDRVVVSPVVEGDRTTAGGIVIPDTAKERPATGTVIATGPAVGAQLVPGQRIVYGKYSGYELTLDEQTYIVLGLAEIMSVLEPTSSHAAADAAVTDRMERHGRALEAERNQQFPDADEEGATLEQLSPPLPSVEIPGDGADQPVTEER